MNGRTTRIIADNKQCVKPESPAQRRSLRLERVGDEDVEHRANFLEKPTTYMGRHVASLEVRWPAEGKAKTLLNRVDIKDISRFSRAFPNGLYAVLKYEEPDKDENGAGSRVHYLVVDNAGNILDRLFFHHLDKSLIDGVEPLPAGGFPEELQ
ncbi:MAG: hypothetical protein ACHRXM_05460 [Isosphaerales bacterium]